MNLKKMFQILIYFDNKLFYLCFLSELKIALPLPFRKYNCKFSLTISNLCLIKFKVINRRYHTCYIQLKTEIFWIFYF